MQVNKEHICFSSKTIELSENENYIELTNRVCYYSVPNLNNVELPYDETSLDKAKTLINMPVVAKYTTNSQGEPTFKGHEVYYDEDGNIYFGTDNIGTHYDVYIQEDTVVTDLIGTTQVLPCLFAKYRIWKRNQNVVDAVHRLYNEGKLYSSWEIETISYQYNNGIKVLTDYTFLSNCLLGYEYAYPAYGEDAKAIQMSQKDSQLLVAEAFSKDILENNSVSNMHSQKKDGDNVNKKDNKVSVDTSEDGVVSKNTSNEKSQLEEDTNKVKDEGSKKERGTEAEKENKKEKTSEKENAEKKDNIEKSELTDNDVMQGLYDAIAEKLGVPYYYISIIANIVTSNTVWVQRLDDENASDLDVIVFTYSVEDDVVTVSEPTNAKLTVSVTEINTTVAELNKTIEEKNSALVNASSKVKELNTQIATLTPYKEAADKAEKERIEAETATKREELKQYAIKSGFIVESEFESNEDIKASISSVSKKDLDNIISERFIASLNKPEEKEKIQTSSKTDIKKESASAKLNLINNETEPVDGKNIMHSIFAD